MDKPLSRNSKSSTKSQGPTLAGISLRWISLICLTLQTTSIIILYSYSRKTTNGQISYLSSTVVVIAELLKLVFCFLVILKESGFSLSRCWKTLDDEIFSNLSESIKVLIPAGLYAIQNNLAFYALNNLDPATYQVAYQLKILTTALFSVFIVHKTLRRKQWLALVLLFIGISLVQMPDDRNSTKPTHFEKEQNRLLGLLAVVACCISSGFSGVYFERLIKFSSKQSLWIRNFQLAVFCLSISIVAMFYQDHKSIQDKGILQGYTSLTWIIVCLQAFGGLLVATVVKHADNILKGFATSISIILSTCLSLVLFDDFNPSRNFYLGATIVISSTIMYSR